MLGRQLGLGQRSWICPGRFCCMRIADHCHGDDVDLERISNMHRQLPRYWALVAQACLFPTIGRVILRLAQQLAPIGLQLGPPGHITRPASIPAGGGWTRVSRAGPRAGAPMERPTVLVVNWCEISNLHSVEDMPSSNTIVKH